MLSRFGFWGSYECHRSLRNLAVDGAHGTAHGIWRHAGHDNPWAGKDGARYDQMHQRGELKLYEGRVTPVSAFMGDIAESLRGQHVAHAAMDSYKDAEVKSFLERAGIHWRIDYRTCRRRENLAGRMYGRCNGWY